MLRWATPVLLALLLVTTLLGLAVALLPAFGFFPAVGGTGFTLAHWQELAQVPGLGHSIRVSLLAGLVTPAISLATVFLFLASASGSVLDSWIRRLVSPVLAIPHAAAAFGLAFLIAPSGFLFRLVSPTLSGWERPPDLLIVNDTWGISMIVGLIVKEVPFLLLMCLAALPQIAPADRVRLARSLGYRPTVAWLKVVAPALYPLIRLPLLAIIAFSSATVDVALILGPTLPPTLSVMLLDWFNDPDLQQRFLAGAAAVLQLGLSLIVIGCWLLAERMVRGIYRRWIVSGNRRGGHRVLSTGGRIGLPAVVAIMLVSLLVLMINSFSGLWQFPHTLPGDWTLQAWVRVLPGLAEPLANTLVIAVLATGCSLLLVVGSLEYDFRQKKKSGLARWVLYIPLVIPQVVFLFGLVVFTESMQWQPGLVLVICAHVLLVIPYTYLTLADPYRRLDPRWLHTAATLGASPASAFRRVRLPLLLGPLLTSAAVGVAISVSLFLPTQLAGAGRVNTITTEAVALASGGNASIIAVWALLQALLPMLVFVLALAAPVIVWRHRKGMQAFR